MMKNKSLLTQLIVLDESLNSTENLKYLESLSWMVASLFDFEDKNEFQLVVQNNKNEIITEFS